MATTTLSELIATTTNLGPVRVIAGASGTEATIHEITLDSREVVEGTLFCCSLGEHRDGHDFASAAVDQGASALVVDRELMHERRVPQLIVGSTRIATAELASSLFGNPSTVLRVVGVTGTNGKTTTTHILQCALGALGAPAGTIGTLSGKHTTPEAPEVQRRLAAFVVEGKKSAAVEVSSHALALDRVVGTRFAVAVFTNLGRDHLDLHGTQERYFAAKAKLFTPGLSDQAVVNVDDVHGRLLLDAATIPTSGYRFADAQDLEIGAFHHSYTWRETRVHVGLGGRFNVMNSLAAATALSELGYSDRDVAEALGATTPVPGRFEPVRLGQDFAVIVDYAHTPDALSEVLSAARGVAAGNRVIVVFGCGGDRDHEKRAEMGSVAATLADFCVVTSDNPRSEDPMVIINDIIAGVPASYRERVMVLPERREAIAEPCAGVARRCRRVGR